MGPVLLLDKSAFQALSHEEHFLVRDYFFEDLAPVLVLEILGDLSKTYEDGADAKAKVVELSHKFLGSGPAVNVQYDFICVQSLLGAEIPLVGKMVPQAATTVPTRDGGGIAMLVDLAPANRLIMHMQDGRFTELHEELSKAWRSLSTGLNLKPLNEFVNQHKVVVPRAHTDAEAVVVARGLLDTPALQTVWLEWLLSCFVISRIDKARIVARWRTRGLYLRQFAPYADFCLHALLTLFVTWRNNLIRWSPTNLVDLHYLYYVPFCKVFVSDDKLHRRLAHLLMFPYQEFVPLADFKRDIRRTAEYFNAVPPEHKQAVHTALGGYPPPLKDSVVYRVWSKLGGPWCAECASEAPALDADERRWGIEYVTRNMQ